MAKPVVELKDVSIFQRKNLILHDINLTIERGEFVYLIGKTGSGKSSLLKILYGDLPLKKGSGMAVDFDLATLKEAEIPYLRRKIGVVFQDFKLLPDRTVFGNLEFVLRATGWQDAHKIETRINSVLTKVKMQTKVQKHPHELSGGEQQRVAIARALLNDPDLILADEPTGNLDDANEEVVVELFRKLHSEGTTLIVVTHDIEVAEVAQRMIVLRNGKISKESVNSNFTGHIRFHE